MVPKPEPASKTHAKSTGTFKDALDVAMKKLDKPSTIPEAVEDFKTRMLREVRNMRGIDIIKKAADGTTLEEPEYLIDMDHSPTWGFGGMSGGLGNFLASFYNGTTSPVNALGATTAGGIAAVGATNGLARLTRMSPGAVVGGAALTGIGTGAVTRYLLDRYRGLLDQPNQQH